MMKIRIEIEHPSDVYICDLMRRMTRDLQYLKGLKLMVEILEA